MQQIEDLKPRQQRALTELLARPSVAAAAEAVGISASQLYRWLHEPAFKEAFRHLRRDALTHAAGRLQRLTTKAADALEDVLDNPDNTASSRVRAAATVLDFAYRAAEIEDLAARLDAIEATLEAKRNYARP